MNINYTQLPGLSPLASDFLNDYPKLADFFAGDYRDISSYKQTAERTLAVERPSRQSLCTILRNQQNSFMAGESAMQAIDKLEQTDAVAVVTGQQAGLFGGPLYTIYKAFTAIQLAKRLETELNRPVVPVFYLVSEDHDFAEVNHMGLMDQTGAFRQLVYTHQTDVARQPVGDYLLQDSITDVLAELDSNLPDTEFKEQVLADLKAYYQPGLPFHIAFGRWFHRIFARHGVVLFDSSDAAIKPFLSDVFRQELEQSLTLKGIETANTLLAAKGYHQQIQTQSNRPNLCVLDNGRHSLEKNGAKFINLNNRKSYTLNELLDSPERLSPKVGLRPIVQDTLFPTVAYVGGPGEIAYWAQLKPVYQQFNLPMPVVVPRAGMTLIEPKIKRHMDKYELDYQDVLTNPTFMNETIERIFPTNLDERIATFKSNLEQSWQDIETEVVSIDPQLTSMIDKTHNAIARQLEQLQNKTLSSIKNKQQITVKQLEIVQNYIRPNNSLQERQMNSVYYLCKYGWGVLEQLEQLLDVKEFQHSIGEL